MNQDYISVNNRLLKFMENKFHFFTADPVSWEIMPATYTCCNSMLTDLPASTSNLSS